MHQAVGAEVVGAFELKAHLVEVVPVARRDEVVGEHSDREVEVVRRAFAAMEQLVIMEDAAARMAALLQRQRLECDQIHDFLPGPMPPYSRRHRPRGKRR